jgi:EAL and modified HD-GYP domain-containing signal transduction protein
MREIVDKVDISRDVRAALLERAGDYGAMLSVAEALEHAETGRDMGAALGRLGLSVKQVREIELAAFGWVRELGAEVH